MLHFHLLRHKTAEERMMDSFHNGLQGDTQITLATT